VSSYRLLKPIETFEWLVYYIISGNISLWGKTTRMPGGVDQLKYPERSGDKGNDFRKMPGVVFVSNQTAGTSGAITAFARNNKIRF
jgi:hypothetical protein